MLMFDMKPTETEYLRELDTSDFEVSCFDKPLNRDTKLTVKECDETVILSVFITSDITKEVIEKFKNLRVIVTRSGRSSHIDTNFCRDKNIAVINVPDYAGKSIAQYVIGSVFAMTRGLAGGYNEESDELEHFSLGVIGTGSVGSVVCEMAHRLGMKVYANDIIPNKSVLDFAEYVSFNDIFRKSDIVTLHIPYVKEYKNIISEVEIKMMKSGGYIINTSYPELIDMVALYQSLISNHLKGVTLDMVVKDDNLFYPDTKTPDYDGLKRVFITQKLLKMKNVIITPGISSRTKNSIKTVLKTNFHDIKDFYIGRKTNRVV